jgi:hypothetical protein
MQDIKLPTNKIEAFQFWMNDMTCQFVSAAYASKKRIPVSYSIPVRDESKMVQLHPCTTGYGVLVNGKYSPPKNKVVLTIGWWDLEEEK